MGRPTRPIKKSGENAWSQFRRYRNLGVEFAVAIFVGAFGGYKIDEWFSVEPLFLILGFFVGVAAGFLNFYRLITSEEKMLQSEKRNQKTDKKKDS